MAMLRHRDRRNSRIPAVLLYSSRNLEDVIYRKELGRALPQISSRLSGLSPHCRAWVAGPGYRDIVSLFERAHERLKPSGTMYVLLSSDFDLHFLGQLIARAGFRARMATAFSIMIELMIIYELTRLEPVVATAPSIGQSTDYFVPHQGATDELNRVPA